MSGLGAGINQTRGLISQWTHAGWLVGGANSRWRSALRNETRAVDWMIKNDVCTWARKAHFGSAFHPPNLLPGWKIWLTFLPGRLVFLKKL